MPPTDIATTLSQRIGGAVFFSLPMLMTMEMWWLGFYMDRLRLALLLVLNLPFLVGLARTVGTTVGTSWTAAFREALTAYGVGIVVSAAMLLLLGVLNPPFFGNEVMGKIGLQLVPASIGAIVAAGQFQEDAGGGGEVRHTYAAHLFFVVAGAVFLGFAVAPTEEMILIAFKMGFLRAAVLALVTLAAVAGILHWAAFRRRHGIPASVPAWSVFLRFAVPAYAVALLVSGYVLWTFGRFDHTAWSWRMVEAVVLGFPAGLGAAGARLLL